MQIALFAGAQSILIMQVKPVKWKGHFFLDSNLQPSLMTYNYCYRQPFGNTLSKIDQPANSERLLPLSQLCVCFDEFESEPGKGLDVSRFIVK